MLFMIFLSFYGGTLMNETERLKEFRKQQKMTQKDFADKIGISRTYYSNIENGSMPLTTHILDMICFKFKVSKEWILKGKGNTNITDTNDISFLTEQYNTFKNTLDKLVLEASENEVELIVNSFSYFVSTLINFKKTDSKEYLNYITQLYDTLEKYCFALSIDKPKSNNYEKLYNIKLKEEHLKNELNNCISNITSLFTNA